MTGNKEMIGPVGSIPKTVCARDVLEVAAQITDQVLATVGVGHVQNLLQHVRAERQVKEMGFVAILGDKMLAFLQLLHEPPFRSIYPVELGFMEYRPFSFAIYVNL